MQNCANPDASIAKSILLEEFITFCLRYLDNLDNNVGNKMNQTRNHDRGNKFGRIVGKEVNFQLDPIM